MGVGAEEGQGPTLLSQGLKWGILRLSGGDGVQSNLCGLGNPGTDEELGVRPILPHCPRVCLPSHLPRRPRLLPSCRLRPPLGLLPRSPGPGPPLRSGAPSRRRPRPPALRPADPPLRAADLAGPAWPATRPAGRRTLGAAPHPGARTRRASLTAAARARR
ncbi:potassium/sodium hyperpolarization-activated cyclic nucleotide-gated channel 2-like [Nannospalax galili]|uniref:potassium/sodium hyperpolarization-activated cyclic nucleotide-gated channel 2-like n=1 Tax=Nannospalax galili TaxID=1026970 RepID=UPI00111C1729|nr:potassium/sodium hyperpolarization-activated cyclic nucleotide-gated channel 2-like [Nannospalax galili]